ncbi:MAG: ThiF family adenylyltransferase [Actinomycetota bacterium]|nr:ThiF family adenylyltransferase [Actinomycetota bacterium]
MELVWAAGVQERIRRDLLSSAPHEHGGAVLARFAEDGANPRVLALDYSLPAEREIDVHGVDALRIDPDFWARVGKQARRKKLSVLPVHTHPGARGEPRFSSTDVAGERRLLPVLERMTGLATGAVVVGSEAESFGFWTRPDRRITVRCRDIGSAPVGSKPRTSEIPRMFSRNVLAFGEQGQELLGSLRVGVVGASGTGSHVCEQLIRLGIGTLVVVDPDHVEEANLNRIVTASRWDARRKRNKAKLIALRARRTTRATEVQAVRGDVRDPETARELFDVDMLFACTDTVSSRAVLNRIAVQRFVPLLDCGTEISTARSNRLRAFANVRFVLPGSACLVCMGVIDPEQLRVELMPSSEHERDRALGYIRGEEVIAPAVVSLNGVAASLVVMRCLEWAVGQPATESAQWVYRSFAGDVRAVAAPRSPDCPVCGIDGRLGRVDLDIRL